jgi:nitrogen fixation protein NifU and related proteins
VSLDELYRQVILDHYRKPRHAGHIEGADARAEGQNPLCGDEVTVELRIEDGKVTDVAVRGRGCSISQASGSMMADKLIGLSTTEIDHLVHQVKRLLDIEPGDPGVNPDRPGGSRRPRSVGWSPPLPGENQVRRPAVDHPPGGVERGRLTPTKVVLG